MSNSDILIVILVVAVLLLAVAVSMLFERYRSLNTEVLRLRSEVTSRNSNITAIRSSRAIPRVDAKAVTTYRDSNDLPLTGRMSQGVRRVKSDASPNNDYRLPDDTGSSPA